MAESYQQHLQDCSEGDSQLHECCKPVAESNDAQLLACIEDLLKTEPGRPFSPYEISNTLNKNPRTVRSALSRHANTDSCKIIRVGHGLYQYAPEKSGQIFTLLSKFGRVGFENLVYVKNATSGTPPPMLQSTSSRELDPNVATAKSGYPRVLATGQEVRWEIWLNGTEKISFVSNGIPFSLDLIIYLHKELENEGLSGDSWKRTSIEVNVDGNRTTITPESVTVQDTFGVILKAYNHGKQLRAEVADRREVSLKDSLSFLLMGVDQGLGTTAIKEIAKLRKEVEQLGKTARIALNVATKERDRRINSSSERCKK